MSRVQIAGIESKLKLDECCSLGGAGGPVDDEQPRTRMDCDDRSRGREQLEPGKLHGDWLCCSLVRVLAKYASTVLALVSLELATGRLPCCLVAHCLCFCSSA